MGKLHWRYRRRLDEILDGKIPDSCRYKRKACATYRDVIERLMEGGRRKVYVAGGLVRDLVSGADVSSADVDIKFGEMGRAALKSVFDDMGLAMRVDARSTYTYFFVGCDPDNQLEGHMIMPGKAVDIESPANSLMVDLEDMTLVDPTGVGVEDARRRVWRIPPGVDRDAWFDRPTGSRLLWRMMKFRLRGFSVPPADVDFVYRKFAGAVREGKVKAADYRNLINQLPDPTEAVAMIVRDAAERGLTDDAVLIASRLVRSGEVWKRIEAQGNVPFQTVCGELREAVLRKREDERRGERARKRANRGRGG